MIRRLPAAKYLRVARALFANKLAGDGLHPFYASFKLTRRCRFACPFCNVKDEPIPDRETGAIKRVLDNLSASSVLLVSFEGGEPLLRNDLGELLRYAHSKNFYLLLTTSERRLENYPLLEYATYVDFFHVSIDEGHDNLEMFERLEEFRGYETRLSVQTVVTRGTIAALARKAELCFRANAGLVVMPAVHMNGTVDVFPDLDALGAEVERLKRTYPETISTPDGFFRAARHGRCSPASVIIDSDCRLYYPCHILERKGPDLSEVPLMDYLRSDEAGRRRKIMRACERRCGWYQYFSTESYVAPVSLLRTLKSALSPVSARKRPGSNLHF
jgi:MoaA/NifB/PqqE/SkfB family radical SAM enzyme